VSSVQTPEDAREGADWRGRRPDVRESVLDRGDVRGAAGVPDLTELLGYALDEIVSNIGGCRTRDLIEVGGLRHYDTARFQSGA
jgi:hypothetical protein